MIFAPTLFAQTKSIEGTIDKVEPAAQGLTLAHNGTTTTFDVSRKANITVKGATASLGDLMPGDTAVIEVHEELGVITKITAAGKAPTSWLFIQLSKAEPDTAYLVSNDGGLLCFQQAGYAIESGKSFNQVNLGLEFRYTKADRISKNGGAIVIGAKSPDLTSTDWTKRIPLGFEVKLAPGQAGDIVLPSPTFKVELPLGQKREGRRVSRTKAKELSASQWNKLEIEVDSQNNVTIKLNGEVVNKLSKAESVAGRIVIWPLGSEMQFRNAIAKVGDNEEKLTFDRIVKPKH
jgi:hypothetical protein